MARFIYSIIELSPYEYGPITGHDKRYLWLFSDSIASGLKNNYSIGNQTDALYIYEYKDSLNLLVWDLKSNKNINIRDIDITRNNWFSKLAPPSTFFSYYFPPNVDVEFKTKLSFTTTLRINLGNGSEIINELKSESFHCIYGQFTKFSFSNEIEDEQVTFDYGNLPVRLNLIFYKARDSFFIIIINPNKKGIVDEEKLKLIKFN